MKKHLLKSINFYLIGLIMLLSAGEVWGQCTTDADYTATAAPDCNTKTVTIDGPGHKTVVSGFQANKLYDLYLNSQTNNVNCVQARWQNSSGGAIGGWFAINYANSGTVNFSTVMSPANAARIEITTGKSDWVATSAVLSYRKTNVAVNAGGNKTISCPGAVELGNVPASPTGYCTQAYTNVESINRVTFAGIDNTTNSGGSGGAATGPDYEDFTNITTDVVRGSTHTLTVWGHTNGNYTCGVTVSIDWNRNGTFETNEQFNVGTLTNVTNGSVALNITIPAGASIGRTRMRVAKAYDYYPAPCTSYGHGQTEDYTLNVVENGGISYSWSPSTGLNNPNILYPIASPGETTTYTLSVNGADCVSGSTTAAVTVNPTTAFSVNAGADKTICSGQSVALGGSITSTPYKQTIHSANFNSGWDGWSPSQSVYVHRATSFTNGGETITSGGTNFVYICSDCDNINGTLTFTSPAMSTVGLTDVKFKMRQYFRQASPSDNSRNYLEYSTDGITWTSQDITESTGNHYRIGTYNNFATSTYNVPPAFANKPVVYFRLRHTFTVDWSWSWDDIEIYGDATVTPSWSGVPIVSGGSTLTATVNPTATTTYTLTGTSSYGGCKVKDDAKVTVNSTPAQPSTITGTATVCSGTNNTYSVTNVAGVTYNWSYSGTGTISGSGNSISLNNITSSGTLTVTPSNSCGNGTARTLAITVTPTPAQPSTITGTATVCSGTNNTYSVTNVAGVTYNWTYTGTATISGSGNSRTLTNITSGGTLTVTPSNGCGNGAARTLAIAVNPNMTAGAASSTPTVCINTALTAITHTTTGVTSIGTATNLPAGVSANFASNTITISGTPTASGTFNYSIPLNGTCGTATATGTITVTAAPTPTFTSVSPTTNICEGTNVTYTTQSGKSNYTWTIPGVAGTDYTLVSGGTTASNTAVVAWKNANNAVVQVNYTDNGCVGASAANATAVTLPTPNSILAGVDNQTCYVNGTNPVRFYGASSRDYIGSVNANGHDLGLVTMESFLNGVGYMEDCTDPANTSSWTTYMGRSWSLTSTAYPNSANFPSDVTVSLPFSDTEFSTMNTQAPSLTPNNPNDDGASLGDLMVTKVSNAAVKGAISQADCGNATILGIANSGTGSNILGIASTHFVDVNVGQFSSFFVHKNNGMNSALPITLTSFAGNCDNGVQLSWVTASENNVSHYEIYRSRDGQTWELATTAGAVGNSNVTNSYSATDNSGVETMYYRLRSVDNDGTYEDFAPISVVCNTESATWAVYPVPATTTATVTITTPTASNDVMSIMDVNGRLISQENIHIEAGVNNFQLDVRKLSEGTYFIHLKDNEGQLKPLKFLKIN